MPTYDFSCPICGQPKSAFATYDQEVVIPSCDNCTILMTRVWSSNPIHFKGNGWGHQ